MADQYVKSGQGFLVVYSLESRKSYNKADWYFQIIERVKDRADFPKVLVANKCDLEESKIKVTKQEGLDLANHWQCPYFETSAKSRIRHEEPFIEVVNLMRKFRAEKGGIDVRDTRKKVKKKCIIL